MAKITLTCADSKEAIMDILKENYLLYQFYEDVIFKNGYAKELGYISVEYCFESGTRTYIVSFPGFEIESEDLTDVELKLDSFFNY